MNNGMVSVLIILKGRNVNPDNGANIKQNTNTVYKINEIVRIRPFCAILYLLLIFSKIITFSMVKFN